MFEAKKPTLGAHASWLVLACTACAAPTHGQDPSVDGLEEEIVDVSHTPVERQAIGNCWVYAASAWTESIHKSATGDTFDVSESYWTYLHWFLQITGPNAGGATEISTGGDFREISRIIRRYGVMPELSFVAEDSNGERALSQSTALSRVNAALGPTGALASPEARRDALLVRGVLDDAFALSETTRAHLDAAFGRDLARVFGAGATPTGTPIMAAESLAAKYSRGDGRAAGAQNLRRALDEWREISYSPSYSRATLQRMQRALHAREPVVVSWFVDFNALESDARSPLYGSFNLSTLERAGRAGSGGGHMVVMEDYQARVTLREFYPVSEWSYDTGLQRGQTVNVPFGGAESVTVPEGQVLALDMRGDGDGDLIVQKGSRPVNRPGGFVCRPYGSGSEERCEMQGPGEFFASVIGYRASNVTLSIIVGDVTTSQQVLEAGRTLDPGDPAQKALLDAALDPSTQIEFLRIKNSWGANRAGLPMARFTERGYHDLYMDYLNGPIAEPKSCPDGFAADSCRRGMTPLNNFLLPPGY